MRQNAAHRAMSTGARHVDGNHWAGLRRTITFKQGHAKCFIEFTRTEFEPLRTRDDKTDRGQVCRCCHFVHLSEEGVCGKQHGCMVCANELEIFLMAQR